MCCCSGVIRNFHKKTFSNRPLNPAEYPVPFPPPLSVVCFCGSILIHQSTTMASHCRPYPDFAGISLCLIFAHPRRNYTSPQLSRVCQFPSHGPSLFMVCHAPTSTSSALSAAETDDWQQRRSRHEHSGANACQTGPALAVQSLVVVHKRCRLATGRAQNCNPHKTPPCLPCQTFVRI